MQHEVPLFASNYHRDYRPPLLNGHSPVQRRADYKPFRLTTELRSLVPDGRRPITAGDIHVIRKVNGQGTRLPLNETWSVGKKWMDEYVWSVIDLAE